MPVINDTEDDITLFLLENIVPVGIAISPPAFNSQNPII